MEMDTIVNYFMSVSYTEKITQFKYGISHLRVTIFDHNVYLVFTSLIFI